MPIVDIIEPDIAAVELPKRVTQHRPLRYARDLDGALVLPVTQAAMHYGVSRRTIYNWIKAGRVACRRQPGGCRRVVIVALAAGADDEAQ